MPELLRRALLPAGLRDVLPPEAALEAAVVERLIAVCAARGYQRVKPPLVEFEDTLLAGSGADMAAHSFRLMDPVSQRMMALRADMTLQVGRIAAARLAKAPRPLRLSYAGEVLRVKGSQLRHDRQFGQVGAELIGSDAAAADAEAVLLAAEALQAVGVAKLTIDLSSPRLVPAIVAAQGLSESAAKALRRALDRKDAAAVAARGGDASKLFAALLKAAGPADAALKSLARMSLPPAAASEAERLAEVVRLVHAASPKLRLTIDPVENRGFEYHTGLCFTLFVDKLRGELGRGGRYLAGEDLMPGRGEPATGFTLYMDTLLRALPEPAAPVRLFVPFGAPPDQAARWREESWITVAGLEPAADDRAEARRLGCSHVLLDGKAIELG